MAQMGSLSLNFNEPKKKNGDVALGVSVNYNENNIPKNRWFLNGEYVSLEKLASSLGYASNIQFSYGVKKYGVALMLTRGLDKLKESKNG